MYRSDSRVIIENEQEREVLQQIMMEDLLNKLKLLNYGTEFVNKFKMKPIYGHYFVVPKNPGEQFFTFISLASWLIRKGNKLIEMPQEYDDPNTTIANILEKVRESGGIIDFPPNKLKQGVGEQSIYVLNHLADVALKEMGFIWQKPKPPVEKEVEENAIEDESELILDKVEEEMAAAYSDEAEEEQMIQIDDLRFSNNKKSTSAPSQKYISDQLNLVDQESWKLEVERVLPHLKVTVTTDNRDWRSHLEEMKTHRNNINSSLVSTKSQLDKLHKDISVTLDKISSREKHLNRELEPILEEYRLLQDELSKVKDNYDNINGGIKERNKDLAKLTEQLENVKQQMEERGSSMTDGAPLVNIKKAVSKVKQEITEMDIRIGVLEAVLLQSVLKNQKLLEEDLRSPRKQRLG